MHMTSLRDLAAVFAGRRVFVTGHTGFKGAWLCVWLQRLGAAVAGFSLDPPSSPSLFATLGLEHSIPGTRGDILDLKALQHAMAAHAPQLVIHMAAQPLVLRSFREPLQTLATNVMGTAHVLEACRAVPGVDAVINVTSDKCYENREWVWGYREHEAMGGHDPYSASKGCAELVASAYHRSFFSQGGPKLASVRAGNVIGGGDWGQDRLLPDCIRALCAGTPISIRRPNAIRPWQHVLEPLSGYLTMAAALLTHQPKDGEANPLLGGWNFGPRDPRSLTVGEVVSLTLASWGGGEISLDEATYPHEAHHLRLDCSKAAMLLGWHARWDAATAVEQSVAWYRRWHDGASAEALLQLMHEQIDAYCAATS